MKVTVCDNCGERIDNPELVLTPEGDEPKPDFSVHLNVRILDGSTKTPSDLCWDCIDLLRAK
jgi:hypothetical protein